MQNRSIATENTDQKLSSRGQALVPVIFIMLILTTLIVGIAITASREIRAGKSFSNQTRRFFAARGAIYYAASALGKSSNNGATYGVVSGSDIDSKGWMQVGDAWVKFDVVDTAGLINLNSADADSLNRIPVFKNSPEFAACIVDWRTSGDQASQNGAKSDYYQSLTPPYDCKSAPFDSVEELLLVKGFTPKILFGNGTGESVSSNSGENGAATGGASSTFGGGQGSLKGLTRQVSAGGTGSGGTPSGGTPASGAPPPAPGSSSGAGQANSTDSTGDTDWDDTFSSSKSPLSELFTTTVRERNLSADGSARINLNTATADDLVKGLGISQELANLVVTHRQGGATGGGTTGGGNNNGANGGGSPSPGGGGQLGGAGANLGRPNSGGGKQPKGLGEGGGQLGRPGGRAVTDLDERFNQPRTRQATGSLGAQGAGKQGGGGLQTGGSGSGGLGGGSGNLGGGSGAGGGTSPPGGGSGTSGGQAGGGSASGGVYKSIADLMAIPNRRQTFDRETMQQIADKVTVDDKPYHENLVNINTASAEVLATVPGMDHSTLQAIIDYRSNGKAFQSLDDLFSISSITRQQYMNTLPHLCAKSSLYRVRVRVRTQGQSSIYAATALIEMTDNGPRVRQWREVPRASGWETWVDSTALPAPSPPTSTNSTKKSGGL